MKICRKKGKNIFNYETLIPDVLISALNSYILFYNETLKPDTSLIIRLLATHTSTFRWQIKTMNGRYWIFPEWKCKKLHKKVLLFHAIWHLFDFRKRAILLLSMSCFLSLKLAHGGWFDDDMSSDTFQMQMIMMTMVDPTLWWALDGFHQISYLNIKVSSSLGCSICQILTDTIFYWNWYFAKFPISLFYKFFIAISIIVIGFLCLLVC